MDQARLTPHFTLSEFACKDGHEVPDYAVDDVRRLCRLFLEPLRASWGPVRVVSGYRTRDYNRRVGGAPASFHVYLERRPGAAADVVCARGVPAQWQRTLARLDPGGLGLYASHVHVDTREGHARW